MTWIKVEVGLPDKPEVMRMARVLHCSRNEVLGLLVRFWIWADRSTVDGTVGAVVDADVDELVGRVGFAKALKEVGWLQSIDDETPGTQVINIPKFTLHNGESAKKRALKSQRQAKWRSHSRDDAASTDASTREEKRRYKTIGGNAAEESQNLGRYWELDDAGLVAKAKSIGVNTLGESRPQILASIRAHLEKRKAAA